MNISLPAALALVLLATGAQAQSAPTDTAPVTNATGNWTYNAGAAALAAPRFLGVSRTRTMLVPTIGARYRDWFFADPVKGVGVTTRWSDRLSGNAALGIDFTSRKGRDERRLAGLGDVSVAAALRVGVDYRLGKAFASTKLTSRLGPSNGRGMLFDADIGYNAFASRAALLSMGLTATAMDNRYARNFFGVSAEQSVASGLPAFTASGGLQSAGPFVQAVVRISDKWAFFGRAAYGRLRGDAATSPITEARSQTSVVTVISRNF